MEEGSKKIDRRDDLLKIESKVRRWWDEHDVFVSEPGDDPPKSGEKFFGNFPFPYMNGYLHLGHAFSLSKVEFAAAYHRLRGANVLFPFGFHCTGMPIKAAADKLAREIQQFGNPPVFPAPVQGEPVEQSAVAGAGDRFTGKKSKVVAKTGTQLYQWEIMRSFGLSDEEIAEFQDPYKWLTYFPPLAVEDLKAFGLGVDWRRSFVTTDINQFFDSFVRWQMRKLKAAGKIVKDLRYTIFSPLDGQPCADHDRASGEGVQPLEYTVIKMEVVPPFPTKLSVLEGKRVFLAAATLRPETMYGQTNAWVLPGGEYGAFEINDEEVFIVTERAARNLAYQRYSRIPGEPTCLVKLVGSDLIGLPLKSPLSCNEVIYALPMLSILTDKGTGIVTSVPSDSPDDYMAMHDLKSKPALRAKFGVKDEWILPFDVIPVINIPVFGNISAEKLCTDLKIKSQNEKDKLAEAKRLTYLKGFTEGTMLVGEFAGEKVENAKPKVRQRLIETGQAIVYSEPEKKVMSRSGDECVVALTDQWYINYGESEWKKKAEECLANMNCFSKETRHGFEHTLGWLNQWACSRSFGLGTRIPWDEQFLVESLSDSTIYMAYYTVAHFLQNGDMYGRNVGSVRPEHLTDEVWDFLFCGGAYPQESAIDSIVLESMKREFEYWYPVDLRVSGKDLIGNHLTFSIYNHTAIMEKRHWPRGFRCNGHILLNSQKMSKSTGNFRTLKQAIEEFSADATRFALADAGDGVDDANFVCDTANAAILRLTKEKKWIKDVIEKASSLRSGVPSTYADRVFENEINLAIKLTDDHYRNYMFREALKTGFYNLQAARDDYRVYSETTGMNRDLVWRFFDVQTRLIAPICPHYAEDIWRDVLKNESFVVKAGWPCSDPPDLTLKRAHEYLKGSIARFRNLHKSQVQKKKEKRGQVQGQVRALIYVNEKYEPWKIECLEILRSKFDAETSMFAPDPEIITALQQSEMLKASGIKQVQEDCMAFMKYKKKETRCHGPVELESRLPFSELEFLSENTDLIKTQLGSVDIEVLSYSDPVALAKAGTMVTVLQQNPPSPGKPTAIFIFSPEPKPEPEPKPDC